MVQRTYTMPQAKTASEIIALYAQIIAQSLKLPSQFSALAPKIEYFLREKAYGKTVNLDDPKILQDPNRPAVLMLVERVFLALLRPLLTEEKMPVMSGAEMRLSATPPFPWSGKVADCKRTLFNLTPVGNDFEQDFANFLDHAPEHRCLRQPGQPEPQPEQ